MPAKANRTIWGIDACFVGIALSVLALVFQLQFARAQDAWKRDSIVGLRKDTCIREGPGFQFHAHTRVPENNWAVMVIDGPRTTDGRTWWDTSRKAAGDPSGGTGWVAQDQTDTDCGQRDIPTQPSNQTIIRPTPIPVSVPPISISRYDIIEQLQGWWYGQTAVVKWSIALFVLLSTSSLWRLVGGIILGFISATLSGAMIWLILDLTRTAWWEPWQNLANPIFGRDLPDLALLLGVLPLVSWGISSVSRLVRGSM